MKKNLLSSVFSLSILLFLSLTACNNSENQENEFSRLERRASRVTIIRDIWGVPHIYGKTDADAVFGLLYAQCEDDFNRVEVNYINAMGRMAEVEGEREIYTDLRMKLYIDPEEVKREYEKSPPWLRNLLDAFADGINYYLYRHPEVKPKLITRFEPWMALTFSEGSIGGDIERISPADLRTFYGSDEEPEIALADMRFPGADIFKQEERPDGSNGFAIAPSLSEYGKALLLINPHTSLFFRTEVHVVSEEGLNAYGAVTWGQFFIYQGFNDKCGWMHTSSRADAIDYYYETVVEKDGKYFYRHGDDLIPFTERTIELPYKKNGSTNPGRIIRVYYSKHGPVIREENGKWVTISLMKDHVKALTQSFLRTKAHNYHEFRETMELKTNSSNNTVFADADGNIAYFHGNFMPVRDTHFDWDGIVDGSNAATDWKGLHDLDEMITILNPPNGWIQNCNSTPFTACGQYSPQRGDYPSYMAPDAENPRGIHAVRVLKDSSGFTLEKLLETAYDSYLPAFEKTIPALVRAFDESNVSDPVLRSRLSGPINKLRSWDMRFSENSVPTTLAVYWGQKMLGKVRNEVIPEGGTIFDYIAKKAAGSDMIQSIEEAVNELVNDFGTWEVHWGAVNRYQRINGDIVQKFNDEEPSLPVFFASSQWGSLASFAARKYPGTRKMYGTSGNSFVAVVEFGDSIKAKSILAGGLSGDPESEHFDDQALMYTKGIFKDVSFYRDDIEKNAERTYIPGKEANR